MGDDPVNSLDPSGNERCDGPKCADFKIFRQNLRKAAQASPPTGSHIVDQTFKKIDRFLGKEGSGPTITFTHDTGPEMGSYDSESNTINLDVDDIASKAKAEHGDLSIANAMGLIGGAVLSHEGFHGIYRVSSPGGDLRQTGRDMLKMEIPAYATEYLYYSRFAVTRFFGGTNFRERAEVSCVQSARQSSGTNAQIAGEISSGCLGF